MTKKPKMTPWFPGYMKPMQRRVGVYERKYPDGIYFCYFDGRFFYPANRSFYHVMEYKDILRPSFSQNYPWRGLAENPNKAKKVK